MKHGVALATGIGGFAFGIVVGWLALSRSADSDRANRSQTPQPNASAHSSSSADGSLGVPRIPSGNRGTQPPSAGDLLQLAAPLSYAKTYHNLSARLDGLDAGQIQSLIAELKDVGNDTASERTLGVVLEKLGEIAPRDALAFAQHPENRNLPVWKAIGTAAATLAAEAPDEALERFLAFDDGMRTSALETLIRAASAVTFAWAASLSTKDQRAHYTQQVIHSLARTDPDATRSLITGSGLPKDEQAMPLEKVK